MTDKQPEKKEEAGNKKDSIEGAREIQQFPIAENQGGDLLRAGNRRIFFF